MHHTDHFHQIVSLFHHKKKWNPEIIEFYFYMVFRNIGFGLMVLFVPIFLFEIGYSFLEIILFWIINQLFFLIFVPLSVPVIHKLGVKHSLLLHLPGLAIFTFCLRYLSGDFMSDLLLITILCGLRALTKAPMYGSLTIFITKNMLNHKKTEGQSISRIRIALLVASLLTPLVGGFVTYFIGYNMTFNIAIFFLILAALPLLMTKDQYFSTKLKIKDMFSFSKKLPKGFVFGEVGKWFPDSIVWVFWPIFMILVVDTTLNIGLITFLSFLIGIIASYYLGKRIDKKPSKKFLKTTTRLATGIFYLRTLIPIPIVLLITSALNNVISPLVQISYEKYYYDYLMTIEDTLEMATIASFILEFYYTIGFIILAVIFWIFEMLAITVTPIIFGILFIIFGTTMLLMSKITTIDSKKL